VVCITCGLISLSPPDHRWQGGDCLFVTHRPLLPIESILLPRSGAIFLTA
jgi:hypothetical protein